MKHAHTLIATCLATTLVGTASFTNAAVLNVITPTGVSYTDTTGTYASPSINRLIDGSGISPTIGATVDTTTLNSFTVSSAIDDTGWRRNGSSIPSVDFTFTLAGATSFSGILIANYWEGPGLSNRGVSTFGLEISSNNGGSYTFAQTVSPAQSNGNIEYIDLGTTYTGVTNVRFTGATYFSSDGAQIVGMNEVRFTAVPEPGSTLLGGLGMLALLRRRR